MQTSVCFTIAAPAATLRSGVLLESSGNDLCLHFEYLKSGVIHRSGLLFENVMSYSHTATQYCKYENMAASDGTLVQVLDSKLIETLSAAAPTTELDPSLLNHYQLYFEDTGCYNVVSQKWQALPERQSEKQEK